MLKSFPKLAIVFALLGSSSVGLAAYGGSGVSGTKFPDSITIWTCTATAQDDSGLFWIASSRFRDEARARAADRCFAFGKYCRVWCETNF